MWFQGGFTRRSSTMALIFLLVVLLELEENVQRTPTIRLLEDAICQNFYRQGTSSSPIPEKLCKGEQVQVKVAYIRGILSFFDSLPLIIFGSVFGSIADYYGRRASFLLSVIGTFWAMCWIYMTCSLWNKMPIEMVWVASLFRLIGGGPAIAIAACLTMVSDISEDADRSKNFYKVYSAVLIVDLIGPLITYKALEHSLWLPYTVCGTSLMLTLPVLYVMPDTLPERSEWEGGLFAMNISGIKVYLRFLADFEIAIGIVTVFLAQFRANLIEILLPYTSIRFELELGKVGTMLSVVSAVNIVTFLVILPTISTMLGKRAGWSVTRINIYVARASSFLLALGAAVLAAAPTISLVILGLMVYAMGFGIRLSVLAVLTSLISSSSKTGKLYTLVATTDAIAHLIASPSIQFIWSRALGIGGNWLVLPFVVLTGIFLLAFFASCFMKENLKGASIDGACSDEVREPLLTSDGEPNH